MTRTHVVLDAQKWAKRAFLIDLFALAVLVVVGVALIRDGYALGADFGDGASASAINRLLVDVALGMASLGWLAFRVIRSSYRSLASPA